MSRNNNGFDQLELMRIVASEFSDRGVRDLPNTYFSKNKCLKITINESNKTSSEVIQHNLYDPNYHGGEVLFKGPKPKAKKFFNQQVKLLEMMME